MQNIPRSLLIIIVGAVLVRLVLFFLIDFNFGEQGFFTGDSTAFYQTAKNIISGHGFSRSADYPFSPDARFPPLYPLFIAVSLQISGSIIPLVIFQLLLASLLPIFIWKISGFMTESLGVRTLASGLAAFEPLSIILSILLITDLFSVFFLISAIYFFMKGYGNSEKKQIIFSGIMLGFSVLTKPNAQFLFILGMGVLVWGVFNRYRGSFKEAMSRVLLFVISFLLVLSPWLLRNYAVFGSFSVSNTGFRNVYTDLAVSVLNFETGRPYAEIEDEITNEFARKYGVQNLEENPALGKDLLKEGLKIMVERPWAVLGTLFITWNSFFTQDLYLYFMERFDLVRDFKIDFSPSLVLVREGPLKLLSLVWERTGGYLLIPIVGRLFWVAVNFLWVAGLILAIRQGGSAKITAVFLAVIILYYVLTSTVAGFSDQGRHRFPASLPMFILASYAFFELVGKLKTINYRF